MTGRDGQHAASSTTRNAIAQAAAQEFVERGYAGASLSRIAARLGLTKGALVYHFRAKADFASYFARIVQDAIGQADAFARAQYPECGSRRLLLHFMLIRIWKANEPQLAAGMALLADSASPSFEADEVIRDWLTISVDAFKACQARGVSLGTESALEAAEMFIVTNLGAAFFARHVRFNAPGTKPMRFTRLALTAVGIPDADAHAEEVLAAHMRRLPELRIGMGISNL